MDIAKVMEAKGKFAKLYRQRDGYIGVGVGKVEGIYILRVYVKEFECPFVDELKKKGFKFEGLSTIINVIGEFRAL